MEQKQSWKGGYCRRTGSRALRHGEDDGPGVLCDSSGSAAFSNVSIRLVFPKSQGTVHAYTFIPVLSESLKRLSVIQELCAEVLQTFESFLLFGGVELFLGCLRVIVDGTGIGS